MNLGVKASCVVYIAENIGAYLRKKVQSSSYRIVWRLSGNLVNSRMIAS